MQQIHRCATHKATQNKHTRHTSMWPGLTLWRIRCDRFSLPAPLCCDTCVYLRMHFLRGRAGTTFLSWPRAERKLW